MTTKKELQAKIKDLANLKNIDISLLKIYQCNKKQLENILTCLNISDFQMKIVFEKFKQKYEKIANDIQKYYLHGYFRFYVYDIVKIEG